MAEKIRSRLWCVLLYLDDPSHYEALEAIQQEYNFVGILHDKDTYAEEEITEDSDHKAGDLKKPHYHLILKFTQARWNTALADELGITANYLQQCRNFDNAATYLVHDGLDDKYQYGADELFGPLVPAVMKLLAAKDEDSRVYELMKLIDSMGYISFRSLVVKACEQGMYSDLRRMGGLLTRIVDEHNTEYRMEMDMQAKRKKELDGFEEFQKFTSDRMDNVLPLNYE